MHALRSKPARFLNLCRPRLARGFAPPTNTDGEDRNDYQHPNFKPFDYEKHGSDWVEVPKWKVNVGTEQSPIALFRSQPAEELDGELKIHTFDDAEYRHRYAVNME